ncbi:preprotein translocase subunit SecF [Paenibacillus forsythiae]|uniref:Preprotein translocase subunit SecF n=1 Tax=Paenibacillus forsythiae TaxID=365616 RepID=A0ABU3H736_9BACL|nr:hypothetical protein [Paenibacillus forsythiae]MDT3426638.1 preprotein translocase subunit SecF [Paenibacillus forsythiae]
MRNTKVAYAVLIISILLFIVSLFFMSKYFTLKNEMESSTEVSYKSFNAQLVEFKKALEDYINNNKRSDEERLLVISLAEAQKSFETYGVLVHLSDKINEPQYQQRNQLFLQLWGIISKDYGSLSLEELKKIDNESSIIIQALQESDK